MLELELEYLVYDGTNDHLDLISTSKSTIRFMFSFSCLYFKVDVLTMWTKYVEFGSSSFNANVGDIRPMPIM